MKRKIISVLLVVALVLPLLTLTGCHGNVDPMPAFEVPGEFDESKQYEITFWAKNETNNDQKAVYAKAVEDFEALYPNIKVTLKDYTNYNDIYNDVITNISTSTTPNVCITYPDHIATYITGENVVVPLEGLINDRKYGLGGSEVRFDSPTFDEIIPQYMSECVVNGLYYALPYMRSTEAVYINKDMVEALGYEVPDVLTWDFMFEVANAAMEKNSDGTYKVNGQKILHPIIYKSTDNMMIQLLRQMDADYSNDNAEILIFNEQTEEILYDIAESAKTGAFTTFSIDGYPGNYLNKGQCIFGIDSTAGATWMGPDAPNVDIDPSLVVDFEMAVRPVPQVDPENPKMISQGPSVCIFNKEDPDEVLASWLFTQFLLTNEVQISYAQTEGYVPVTSKAQQSDEYTDYISRKGERDGSGEQIPLYYDVKIAASELLLGNAEHTFVTPVFNGSVSLRNAAGEMIERVTEDTARKIKINDKYMKSLFEKMISLYRLDQISLDGDYKKKITALPTESVVLLVSVGAVMACLGGVVGYEKIKKHKNQRKS